MDTPRPFLNNNQLLVCSLCLKSFESQLDFNIHVSLHKFDHFYIADCCLGASLRISVNQHSTLALTFRNTGLAPVLLAWIVLQQYGTQHDAPIQTKHLALTRAAFTNEPLLCKLSGIAFVSSKRTLTNISLSTRLHMLAFARPSRVRSILLCVNVPESLSPGLVDRVDILGTVDLEVVGFCQ